MRFHGMQRLQAASRPNLNRLHSPNKHPPFTHLPPRLTKTTKGSQDPDGSQEQGADAKKRRRGGAEPREDDTLADAAQLRAKQLDSSFLVDPLFHHMSQIFDEDGAQGAWVR